MGSEKYKNRSTSNDFDLDDYIDYIISMLHFLGPDTHILGVCQPSVPVLAAVAVMEDREDPYVPSTMTLMGGPIDTRVAPTAVNDLAVSKGIDWFKNNVVMKVPFPHPGFMRDVYPGFLQLSGFMSMNLDRHVTAHRDFFQHLVEGDGDNAEKHRDFYDEYLAVMDLTAEFYLQTVETVFIEHALPNGTMMHSHLHRFANQPITQDTPGGTSLFKRSPRFLAFAACLAQRYRSTAI